MLISIKSKNNNRWTLPQRDYPALEKMNPKHLWLVVTTLCWEAVKSCRTCTTELLTPILKAILLKWMWWAAKSSKINSEATTSKSLRTPLSPLRATSKLLHSLIFKPRKPSKIVRNNDSSRGFTYQQNKSKSSIPSSTIALQKAPTNKNLIQVPQSTISEMQTKINTLARLGW